MLKRFASLVAFLLPLAVAADAAATPSTTVVISEVRSRGPSGGNDEFIELFNLSTSSVDLSGYTINASSATAVTSTRYTFPAGTTIAARSFFLLANNNSNGYSGTVAPDATYTTGIVDAGGVALLAADRTIVDQVGFGTGSAYKEGTTLAAFTANNNQSYERKTGGCTPDQDTDNNASDFLTNATTSHPQNSLTVCDACTGIVCNSPPNTACYGTTGTCSGGTCSYTPSAPTTSCPDANACTVNSACDGAGNCVGSPRTCNAPPSPTCADANTLRRFTGPGACQLPGGCTYPSTDTPCPFGCDATAGACSPDPCAGVTCTTAPASVCQDASTSRAFTAPGTCNAGACDYPFVDTACPLGCDPSTGLCATDACLVMRCNTPPPSMCVSANQSRAFIAPGTCANGTCSYGFVDTACSFGCNAGTGACNADPCAGVSCATAPQPACQDATTSRAFTAPGSCSGGLCDYPFVDTSCPDGCDATTGLCTVVVDAGDADADAGSTDAGTTDAGSTDAGSTDASTADVSGSTDAGAVDVVTDVVMDIPVVQGDVDEVDAADVAVVDVADVAVADARDSGAASDASDASAQDVVAADSSPRVDAATDARADAARDARGGDAGMATQPGGCGCTTPRRTNTPVSALALFAVGLLVRRSRRSRSKR